MDAKLAFLIMDVATQRHVVGLELLCSITGNIFDLCNFSLLTVARRRGLWIGNGMPKSLNAIAKLLRMRRIPFSD